MAALTEDELQRKRSQLWMHFSIINSDKAMCDICEGVLSYKRHTTSNLKKHLTTKHPSVVIEGTTCKRQKGTTQATVTNTNTSSSTEIAGPTRNSSEMFAGLFSNHAVADNVINRYASAKVKGTSESSTSQKVVPTTISLAPLTSSIARPFKKLSVVHQKRLNTLLIKMISKDLQTFSIVNDRGFRELMSALNPSYQLPSRTMLTKQLLPQIYESAVEEVKIHLSKAEFVTLTMDGWTPNATEGYIAVTAHYISETWEMCSFLLECIRYDDEQTSESLAMELMRIVTDWGITNKLCAIVTDSTANIFAAVRLTGWMHLPCFAHSINLIVQSGINTIKAIHDKVKTIVDHFHRSTIATNTLRAIQIEVQQDAIPLKLKNDVAMNWISTYYMFQRICDVQGSVEAALGWLHNPVEILTAEEWVILRELCKIFQQFEQIMVIMSQEKYMTLSKVIVMTRGLMNGLSRLRSTLTREVSLNLLEEMITLLAERFQQIQYHPVFSRATFLDPRFKKYGFIDHKAVDKVKECVTSDMSKFVDEVLVCEGIDKQHGSVITTSIAELQQYSEETNIDRKGNPLAWWKSRALVYPRLARVAKKNLGVVATAVPSERVFSKAEQLISERRNRIKPSNVQQLIFLNANQSVFQ
uniref:BED-type domain-containing protein n=1 Tax=Arion vulgaris TaxID=1028688 RepID=A0A0B7BIP8_9EUPU